MSSPEKQSIVWWRQDGGGRAAEGVRGVCGERQVKKQRVTKRRRERAASFEQGQKIRPTSTRLGDRRRSAGVTKSAGELNRA